jgi:hypothetical protein
LAEVRAGKIDIVLVYKVDRLTRSLTDFAKVIELFDAHGVSRHRDPTRRGSFRLRGLRTCERPTAWLRSQSYANLSQLRPVNLWKQGIFDGLGVAEQVIRL